MAQTWIIVGGVAVVAYYLYKCREAEDKEKIRPQVNLDITLKEPITTAENTSFVHSTSKSSKDYQLEYVGPAARGQTKHIYRDLDSGQKFLLYRPIETVLRS